VCTRTSPQQDGDNTEHAHQDALLFDEPVADLSECATDCHEDQREAQDEQQRPGHHPAADAAAAVRDDVGTREPRHVRQITR